MSSSPVPRGLCFNLVDQMWNGINMYQLSISPISIEVETGCNYCWGDPFLHFHDFHDYWRTGIFWWKGIPQKIQQKQLQMTLHIFIWTLWIHGIFIHLCCKQHMWCFVSRCFFWTFTMVSCIKKLQAQIFDSNSSLFCNEGCEAFQVAMVSHPGCNLPYRLRRCRRGVGCCGLLDDPRSYWSGGCFFRDKVDQSSPEYLGKILMLYDKHIIYFHQKCTIYQKSYWYI